MVSVNEIVAQAALEVPLTTRILPMSAYPVKGLAVLLIDNRRILLRQGNRGNKCTQKGEETHPLQ